MAPLKSLSFAAFAAFACFGVTAHASVPDKMLFALPFQGTASGQYFNAFSASGLTDSSFVSLGNYPQTFTSTGWYVAGSSSETGSPINLLFSDDASLSGTYHYVDSSEWTTLDFWASCDGAWDDWSPFVLDTTRVGASGYEGLYGIAFDPGTYPTYGSTFGFFGSYDGGHAYSGSNRCGSSPVRYTVSFRNSGGVYQAKYYRNGEQLPSNGSYPATFPGFRDLTLGVGIKYPGGYSYGNRHKGYISCVRLLEGELDSGENDYISLQGPTCADLAPVDPGEPGFASSGACVPVEVPTFSGAIYVPMSFTGGTLKFNEATVYNSSSGSNSLPRVLAVVVGVSGAPDSGGLYSVLEGQQYFSGVTDAAQSWNPLTWVNSVPNFNARFLYPSLNRLVFTTDFTGATQTNDFVSSQLQVLYYVKSASGGWILPVDGDVNAAGTFFVEDWATVGVYKDVYSTGASIRFESARPIAGFRLVFPAGKAVRFKLSASAASYGTVTVDSCSNDANFGGPETGAGWDELVGGQVPGAAVVNQSQWFSRLGWTRNYLADFVFSVPLTATSATVRVPLPVPQAGGRGLGVALVDVTLSDVDDHSPVWTGGVYVYEDGLRGSAVYDSPVAISEGSGYLTALLAAGFYLFVRIALILAVFYLVTVVTQLMVALTNVAFPVVSDKFANINISASSGLASGVSGAFSAVAWVSVAAVMVAVYTTLLNFGVQVWGYLGNGVLDWVNFLTFGFLRNVGADWSVFAVTVNVVGNTLFVGVVAYAVWRVVQYVGKV